MGRGVVCGITIGRACWPELVADGWRFEKNMPVEPVEVEWDRHTGMSILKANFGPLHERMCDEIERLKSIHGEMNVTTGNAFRDGEPLGIPEQMGLYVREPCS